MWRIVSYWEPQIIELYQNTMPIRFYWIIFSILNSRQTNAVVKREMTKERLDRQLTGKVSATPFMKLKNGKSNSRPHSPHNLCKHRQVTFDKHGSIDQKTDKLSDMMSKMATSTACSPSNKPYIYQGRRKGQGSNYRGTQQLRYRLYSRHRYNDRSSYRQMFRRTALEVVLCMVFWGKHID